MRFRRFLIGAAIGVVIVTSIFGGAVADRLFGLRPLDRFFPQREEGARFGTKVEQKILTEESVVIDVAERVSPSVVTVSRESPRRRVLQFSPFGGFGFQEEGGKPQDIGTGFIISSDGLLVTNKHVVSETDVKYKVVTKDDKEFSVEKIYRDPANDLAILKINPSADSGHVLKPVELGDSSNLKVGQFVIAIGTALGEFRHTVTTGVISGLGRGITAGTPFEGFVERLDNVIQTDAAINPGNSGGPLLNSAGQVIGVNAAIAQGAQNIGFAIPINVVRDSIKNFEQTGSFSRPFLGIRYQMIDQETALLNKVAQGAYIVEVIAGSPAQNAGIQENDILTKLDGQDINEEEGGLAALINKKRVGDRITLEVWRDLPAQA
ncbi:trypsin-like peptidase domain-containing protein, partial [Candidatus Microgenomates bacterium]|nr:trypsin-like peptidase domain-containing protein [Candidatus Microgenomates bacterium]